MVVVKVVKNGKLVYLLDETSRPKKVLRPICCDKFFIKNWLYMD